MQTLVVTAHPDPESLTAAVATRVLARLGSASTAVADLAAEGFDPRFDSADRAAYRGEAPAPADVLAEQKRIDEVEHLVLVFPVYWWSMPALLKGWIDRVFVNGWAFEIDAAGGGTRRKLGRLTIHVIAVAGDTEGTYARHGYREAFTTQIMHGVVDYCGARRGIDAIVHESERDDEGAMDQRVSDVLAELAGAIRD